MTEKTPYDESPPTVNADDADDDVESPATTADAQNFAERYGVRPGMSRARKISLGVVGFLMLCGVAAYIGWNQSHPQIQGTVLSYKTQGHTVNVIFEVDKSADQAVECTLQALDMQGAVIGSTNVNVPSGRSKEDMAATVNTTGKPNTVQVSTCTATS